MLWHDDVLEFPVDVYESVILDVCSADHARTIAANHSRTIDVAQKCSAGSIGIIEGLVHAIGQNETVKVWRLIDMIVTTIIPLSLMLAANVSTDPG